MHDIILELDRAHDDPEVPSAEFQAELRTVTAQLRSAGIEYSQRGMAFDAVDAIGYPLAAFAIKHWGTIAAPPPGRDLWRLDTGPVRPQGSLEGRRHRSRSCQRGRG